MIISRVGFCPECKTAGRPEYGNLFVVKGSHGFHFYSSNFGLKGFVPHFYRLIKSQGGIILFERLCAMHGCGVTIYYNQQQGHKFVYNSQWKGGEMKIKDWNSLVMAHGDLDLGYKI